MTNYFRKNLLFGAIIFLLFGGVSIFAQEIKEIKPPTGRYFIHSQSGFLKTILGVEHSFENGFTTNLTSFQLSLIKTFGIKNEPVAYYKISDLNESSFESQKVKSGPENKVAKREFYPQEQISWAIKEILNNNYLSQISEGEGINIAILDTGVFSEHFDLKNRIKDCQDFTKGDKPKNTCEDQNGHGTHLAGIVAADGGFDAKGIYGVVPKANLYIYKVCEDNGFCLGDDVAAAINFLLNSKDKINIVLMGFGGNSDSWFLKRAIENAFSKNILLFAPAGNNGPNINSVDYPAFYKEVVSVGFTNQKGNIVRESSRGTNPGQMEYVKENGEIEFVAPGQDIESTWINNDYKILSGSSQAAAISAGMAAKLWHLSDNSANKLRNLLTKLAVLNDLWTKGDDSRSGAGLLKLQNLINIEEESNNF